MKRLFRRAAEVALAALWGATVTQAALPLSFHANRGQLAADIRFLADRGDSSIAVAGSGFFVGLRGSAEPGFRVAWVRNGPHRWLKAWRPFRGK
jgi:hypothetical protein